MEVQEMFGQEHGQEVQERYGRSLRVLRPLRPS
jgi:hypothetical protein